MCPMRQDAAHAVVTRLTLTVAWHMRCLSPWCSDLLPAAPSLPFNSPTLLLSFQQPSLPSTPHQQQELPQPAGTPQQEPQAPPPLHPRLLLQHKARKAPRRTSCSRQGSPARRTAGCRRCCSRRWRHRRAAGRSSCRCGFCCGCCYGRGEEQEGRCKGTKQAHQLGCDGSGSGCSAYSHDRAAQQLPGHRGWQRRSRGVTSDTPRCCRCCGSNGARPGSSS